MTPFYLSLTFVVLLLALIPLAPHMAVQPASTPAASASGLYTHFIYMFGHANMLHWLINGWALLVLHNLFKASRLIVVYLLAVIVSFIPNLSFVIYPLSFSATGASLIGSSVITCFFFGFITPYFWYKDRLSSCLIVALILVGFFLPGIAALHHLLMFLFGLAWYYIESLIRSFRRFAH